MTSDDADDELLAEPVADPRDTTAWLIFTLDSVRDRVGADEAAMLESLIDAPWRHRVRLERRDRLIRRYAARYPDMKQSNRALAKVIKSEFGRAAACLGVTIASDDRRSMLGRIVELGGADLGEDQLRNILADNRGRKW
jgi:hypothetical protein